jgi:hypothetical protein
MKVAAIGFEAYNKCTPHGGAECITASSHLKPSNRYAAFVCAHVIIAA